MNTILRQKRIFSFVLFLSLSTYYVMAQEVEGGGQSTPPSSEGALKNQDTLFKREEEVVVTSLGTRSTKSLTYSVQTVSAKDLTAARDVNIMANLQGNVTGLQVSPAATGMGGSMRLVLRGNRSLLGNNQPLIVYNGIVINNSSLPSMQAGFSGGLDLGSPMEDINAADIQDLSVLKGGNSAALYGSLGYNGALVIVGRKGRKRKGLGISFSNSTYTQVPKVLAQFQNEYGQGQYDPATKSYIYSPTAATSWGPKFGGSLTTTPNAYFDATQSLPYQNMGNGLKNFYQLGMITINNISLEKAGDDYSVRFSYGNTFNKYVIPGSKFNKNQFSLAGTYKVNNWIKMESSVSYINQETVNRNDGTEGQGNVFKYFAVAPRSYSTDVLSAHYLNDAGNGHADYGLTSMANPYFIANSIVNKDRKDRVLASYELEIKLYKDLKLRGIAGTDYLALNAQSNFAVKTFTPKPNGGLTIQNIVSRSYNVTGLLEYQKVINNFEVNLTLGAMRYFATSTITNIDGNSFAVPLAPVLYSVGNMTQTILKENSLSNNLLVSGFANFDLSYKEWAYLNATVRRDYTSTINQGFTYPSVSLSILPSEINEQLNFGIFDYWKVRASWAMLNNGGVPYQSLTTTYSSPGTYGNTGVGIARYGGAVSEYPEINYNNPNLKPESTTYYEAGLDFSLLKRRVYLSATYFLMQSTNQIFRLNGSVSTGYVSKVVNAGQINNSGVEVELKTTPVKTRDFAWNLDVNFTYLRSRLVKLAEGIDRLKIDANYNGSIGAYNILNLPYGQLYGTDYLRNPEGKIYYNNQTGTPIVNPNNVSLGSATPDFLIGIRNTFTYKKFTLSVLLDWKQGGKVYSTTNSIMTGNGNAPKTTELRDQYQSGGVGYEDYKNGIVINPTNENLSALAQGMAPTKIETVPSDIATRGVNPSVYWGSYAGVASNFIYNASFMKVREVSLTYTVDDATILKWTKGVIQGASIGYAGRNLFTIFSNTPGIDPESSFNSGNAQGIEFFSMPILATHGITLTLDF